MLCQRMEVLRWFGDSGGPPRHSTNLVAPADSRMVCFNTISRCELPRWSQDVNIRHYAATRTAGLSTCMYHGIAIAKKSSLRDKSKSKVRTGLNPLRSRRAERRDISGRGSRYNNRTLQNLTSIVPSSPTDL